MSALGHRKNSSERKAILTKLRLQRDYHHNMNTLETGEGELITVKKARAGRDEEKRPGLSSLRVLFGVFPQVGLVKAPGFVST